MACTTSFEPDLLRAGTREPGGAVRVVVLDTGLAADPFCGDHERVLPRPEEPWGPSKLEQALAGSDPFTPTDNRDQPDENSDLWLDPVAGHGTFIAGLIARLAPSAEVSLGRVLETTGEGSEADVAYRIGRLLDDPPDLVCLSLGCYTEDDEPPLALGEAVEDLQEQGTVVVASAGNDSTCRRSWPAALPGVIGVGSLGRNGPAPFTNHGAWVDACAPGCDVVSSFFKEFRDEEEGDEQDEVFEGWASWSGTSFSAPIVTAALAREISLFGVDGAAAVERVVGDERLFRFPGLGTVVNLH